MLVAAGKMLKMWKELWKRFWALTGRPWVAGQNEQLVNATIIKKSYGVGKFPERWREDNWRNLRYSKASDNKQHCKQERNCQLDIDNNSRAKSCHVRTTIQRRFVIPRVAIKGWPRAEAEPITSCSLQVGNSDSQIGRWPTLATETRQWLFSMGRPRDDL